MPMPSLLLAAAIAASEEPSLHVALAFAAEGPVPPAVAPAAVHEAAQIWSRYHVVVDRTIPCGSQPDEAIVLPVRAGRSRMPRSFDVPSVLGTIHFADDGMPYSIVTVFFDLLLRSLSVARIGEAGEERWPPELRQRIIGRALGRVIAHEIGHYLLESRKHSGTGLMRGLQPYRELFGESNIGFELSRQDERRFAQSVGR